MDPNQYRVPLQAATTSASDSAILFLDGTDPFGQQPFNPAPQPLPPPPPVPGVVSTLTTTPNGHQILDQVQKELQFLPSNESTGYISGTMISSMAPMTATTSVVPSSGSVMSGLMDSTLTLSTNADTDYLIGGSGGGRTESISLGSPLSPMGPEGPSSNKIKYSIWQFDYYSQYFDLSTDIFFRRVLWSFLPLTGDHKGTYIERHIQSNPDLYGPFWISLTLAFLVTACDNIITFLNQFRAPELPFCSPTINGSTSVPCIPSPLPPIVHHHLAFTFERMHLSLLITFTYVFLAPLVLWSFCQWRGCSKLYTFLECLCAYGYSLAAFIPVALLSLVDIRELQFILFASAAFLSGSVLLISFAPVVHSDPSRNLKFSYIMLLFIFVAHFTIALFYLYIFL